MIKLISSAPGEYETEDGRIMVRFQEDFETWCDADHPHPVRERVDSIRARYEDPRAAERYIERMKIGGATVKTRKTKEGWVDYLCYQCPGDQIHYYGQWVTQIDGDWTDEVFDKFTEAVGALQSIMGEPVMVSHKRKRKPKPEPESYTDGPAGRRYFAKCGHPFEYDIDRNCYVCHEDPR